MYICTPQGSSYCSMSNNKNSHRIVKHLRLKGINVHVGVFKIQSVLVQSC